MISFSYKLQFCRVFYYLPQAQSVGKSLSALLWQSNEGSGFKICWCIWKCERALGVPSNTRRSVSTWLLYLVEDISSVFHTSRKESNWTGNFGMFLPRQGEKYFPWGETLSSGPSVLWRSFAAGKKKKIHVFHLSGCSFLVLSK